MFINKHQYEQKPEFSSPTGTGMQPVYKVQVDDDGSDVLVQVGEHDLYQEIQSYAGDLDINVILDNLQDAPPMVFGDDVQDLTKIPRTLGGWFKFQHDLHEFWYTLTPEMREDIGSVHKLPDYIKEKQKQYAAEQAAYAKLQAEQNVDNNVHNEPSGNEPKGDE